jgi:hypothetical protein
MQRGIAFARNLGRHTGEEIVDQRARQADRLEIIAAAIAADDRDAHLGHDLEQALVDRRAIARDAAVDIHIAKQAARMAIRNRGLGEIGVHRGRADADQHREIMRVEAFGRTHVDGRVGAQPLARRDACAPPRPPAPSRSPCDPGPYSRRSGTARSARRAPPAPPSSRMRAMAARSPSARRRRDRCSRSRPRPCRNAP